MVGFPRRTSIVAFGLAWLGAASAVPALAYDPANLADPANPASPLSPLNSQNAANPLSPNYPGNAANPNNTFYNRDQYGCPPGTGYSIFLGRCGDMSEFFTQFQGRR